MTITKTIDLAERVEEITKELEDISQEQGDIVEEAIEAESNGEDVPGEVEERFDELETDRVELEGKQSTFNRVLDEWGDGVFEISELSYGQVQSISDDVLEKSFDVDMASKSMKGSPKQGYYQIAILKQAIVESPDNAPKDPAEYPQLIGEYLFEKVNAFNTVGDTEMGNMSLEDRMKQHQG